MSRVVNVAALVVALSVLLLVGVVFVDYVRHGQECDYRPAAEQGDQ